MSEFKDFLKKILEDGRVDEHELVYLRDWLKNQEKEDDDYFDLKVSIDEILEDGVIDSEEHEEIFELIKDIIDYRED